MGIEIERKFLVDPTKLPELDPGAHILQVYLSEKPQVRIRLYSRVRHYALSREAVMTIKGEGLLTRAEFEWPIPVDDAVKIIEEELWLYYIVKTRYNIGRFELDRFEETHKGLWMAEIELEHEDESFDSPVWLTEEVTNDARYTNVTLARDGLPSGG